MTDTTYSSSPERASGPGEAQTTAQQAKDQAAGVAAGARDEASHVAGAARDQAGAVASTAVDEAKQLGSEAADQAMRVLDDARAQLRDKAQEESERLGATVAELGQQLRTMADAGDPGLARDLVQQAAGGAEQLAHRMQQGGLERMLDDARRLARNRPGTFLLGAAAAGFVAARVARTADTRALKEAASPNGGNGHEGNGHGDGGRWADGDPDLTLEASQPRPTPQSQGTSPGGASPQGAATTQRPLVADPLAADTHTTTMPAVEDER